jgi:hypothetical protein
MLSIVKLALRITSAHFDTEVTALIEACKLDLQLAGVTVIDESDPLIVRAVTLYAKANFGYDNAESEKFQKSYDLLKCSLSLAGDYNVKMV